MKFKTRLYITFIMIIALPMLLTALAFCGIGLYLMNVQKGFPADFNYSAVSENMKEIVESTDKAFFVLQDQVREDASRLADKEYLEQINSNIARKSTYIIVRKGSDLYYAGNEEAAKAIFTKLPEYGDGELLEDSGLYYDEFDKFVKQVDFLFPDGDEGSAFVVTKANSLISKHLLVDMFVAILLILIFTSVMLTQWLHKGVFNPINEED